MNVWPINAATADGFLVAQIILSVLGLLAAAALQRLVAQTIDPKQTGSQSGPLGGVMPTISTTIAPGSLPRGDDVFLAAAARGPDRLAAALLSAAFADGWLVGAGDGRYTVLRDARPSLKSLEPLHAELARYPAPVGASAVRYSAKRVAIEKLVPRMLPELERLALRRSFGSRVLVSLAPLAVALGLIELARARWAFTSAESDGVGFVMFIGVLGCALLAINPDRRTTTSEQYFGWLWEATAALRADVAELRRTAPDEVALAVVLEGPAGGFRLDDQGRHHTHHPFAPARAKWPATWVPTPPIDLPTTHA